MYLRKESTLEDIQNGIKSGHFSAHDRGWTQGYEKN